MSAHVGKGRGLSNSTHFSLRMGNFCTFPSADMFGAAQKKESLSCWYTRRGWEKPSRMVHECCYTLEKLDLAFPGIPSFGKTWNRNLLSTQTSLVSFAFSSSFSFFPSFVLSPLSKTSSSSKKIKILTLPIDRCKIFCKCDSANFRPKLLQKQEILEHPIVGRFGRFATRNFKVKWELCWTCLPACLPACLPRASSMANCKPNEEEGRSC